MERESKVRDRTIVDRLIDAINRKFEANAHKGTWTKMSDEEVLVRLTEELNELIESVGKLDLLNAIEEAADVALFGAFFADPERVLHEQ